MNRTAKVALGLAAVATVYGLAQDDAQTVPTVPVTSATNDAAPAVQYWTPPAVNGSDVASQALADMRAAAPSPVQGTVVPGECRVFTGQRTVYVCAPAFSPEGGEILRVEEDGSARYSDGYVIDAESGTFYRR